MRVRWDVSGHSMFDSEPLVVPGLPQTEAGRHLNEGQMEVRATAIRTAYRFARQLLLEVAK